MASNESRLLRRTHGCGELTESQAERGDAVVLTGWVHRRRDLGQLIFIELRDSTGTVQVVFDPSQDAELHGAAEGLRAEFVVGVRGNVVPRESPNPDHPTGRIEIRVTEMVLFNRADAVPFPVVDGDDVNEEARLTHRYVDLRGLQLQRNLRQRHRLAAAARNVLDQRRFTEIETPVLTRSTPEGARDYLVPSRVHPHRFYALPQSPQLFKQLLMIAGFDRYFQFARCFRDEDLRADRQPEFTQIDIEMAFVAAEDVYELVEAVIVAMFESAGIAVGAPFARMCYDEAMSRYGSDRPDTRFGLELADGGPAARGSGFKVFDSALERGGEVRGFAVPGGGNASRKQLDRWTDLAKKAGAGGLVWIKLDGERVASPAMKVLGEDRCRRIAAAVGAAPGDAALLVSDVSSLCNSVLGSLRLAVAEELDLVPKGLWNLLWVEDFPLMERDERAGRWAACHHPFTAPRWEEVPQLEADPAAVRAQAYDLVLNGSEIGGGSIRIHRRDVQQKVFRALGIGEEEARAKFGFLLRALDSGAPPHGGIALGFDRICAMICGAESIREVIAFPKTTSASCLMTGSPAEVDAQQWKELHLKPRHSTQTTDTE